MYSTNQQQDGRRQAPNFKTDPDGNKYTITIEDTINEDGSQGIVINTSTINSGITTILEAVAEALSNQEDNR